MTRMHLKNNSNIKILISHGDTYKVYSTVKM